MNSSPIPSDLILEILSRLPEKSVARFHCVSKPWASMLSGPYFTELFVTRSSSAKLRLLFAIAEDKESAWSFFSLPQLQSSYEKSSSAEFHVKFSPSNMQIIHNSDLKYFSCGYASGLIYFHGCRYQGRPLICNPNTGRYVILPDRYSYRKAFSFFGFDPIDKQYKALFMRYLSGPGHNYIITLETGDMMRWRKIKCSLPHCIKSTGICINGVLYYLGDTTDEVSDTYCDVIVCFDVRSEKFTFIDVERLSSCTLINYKGKLALIYWEDNDSSEFRVWVLENVEKQEWSKYTYTLSDNKFSFGHVSVAGMTASGEIVFSMGKYTPKQPFYVFFFNPERNNLRRVDVQGFGEAFKNICSICTFVNHVEDLKVNDLKPLDSVHAPFMEEIEDYDYSSESE